MKTKAVLTSSGSGPEVFFGLVGAVGTDLDLAINALQDSLRNVNYKNIVVKVIDQLLAFKKYSSRLDKPSIYDRYVGRMNAGDDFRKASGLGQSLALLCMIGIREQHRKSYSSKRLPKQPIPRCAYILKSLKHPAEVDTLRRVYGPNFYLISAYTPRDIRVQNLVARIAASSSDSRIDKYRPDAERLVTRDEDDPDNKFGQKVRETFPKADLFIDARDPVQTKLAIRRFIELLFGNTFLTPTPSEYAMFHAHAAALRSAALGRQVGAAIATSDGDIIAVGSNEVPKCGGGQYWPTDSDDRRDFHLGYDPSDKKKKEVLAEILRTLRDHGWLLDDKKQKNEISQLVKQALPILKSTRVMNLTEFGRVVHAEMAALLDAARRGVEVKGHKMYTSTFPCHDCARHIVAAGLRDVVYIEPYPKSLASEFHLDSIAVDSSGPAPSQVRFEPFVGVAPRLYMKLFEMVERKAGDGLVRRWSPATAHPRFALSHNFYLDSEVDEIGLLVDALKQTKIK
ncbi:MAG TPA: anti-phage dCTP deaminase [Nitrospiraceae bacterium]|nr:anti-phage dCTP deaminase [Nitrospiraceae bacterium]